MPDNLNDQEALWQHHHAMLRDPSAIAMQWWQPEPMTPSTLEYQTRGPFWELLESFQQTLFVTREYEHLVMAFSVNDGQPRISWMQLPHPNGMIVPPGSDRLYIASTRNPNLVYEFAPGLIEGPLSGCLTPLSCRFYPGRLYIHDLGWIDGKLHANAVGMNVVVQLNLDGSFQPRWWPKSIDSEAGPRFDVNFLQINSIASAANLDDAVFSASCATPGDLRPGDLDFEVDRKGVIFSGKTRDVIAGGLTRPHSARWHNHQIFVDNSGYGEFGTISGDRFVPIIKLNGWTRGLHFVNGYAIVGSSRVLPRYSHYAPGLIPEKCETGIHLIDLNSGEVIASLIWPHGNQIFAFEMLPVTVSKGFPASSGISESETAAFFSNAVVGRQHL
jgi:uncharacterized protein (TIGR03032 family)